MKKEKLRTFLLSVYDYILFFVLIAFFISCSMMLFLNLLQREMHITLTQENIETAAKLTFYNVLFLSFICATIEKIRKKLIIDKQIQRISDAAEKMIHGDFSVRIAAVPALFDRGQFNKIIHCFNQMAQDMQDSQTLRSDFIANVSHELKTPLAVMQNYATLLSEEDLTRQQRLDYANAVSEAAQRMTSLVTNILKLNKLENQHFVYNSAAYDLSEQLCECLLLYEDVLEKKQLQVETDIEDDVMIESDPEMMAIVWNNLISNAVKFTPQGGTVKLTMQQQKDRVAVSVSDTGCGISPLSGKFIFDKFYQGETSHAGEGNGLGLALVKRIIDLTGNEIAVASEVGKGSTFTVTIKE